MFVMVMTFGMIDTLTTVAIDKERGITNRFRSMPMAPSAVVTGRGVADLLRSMLDLALLAAIALAVGWRADASLVAAESQQCRHLVRQFLHDHLRAGEGAAEECHGGE